MLTVLITICLVITAIHQVGCAVMPSYSSTRDARHTSGGAEMSEEEARKLWEAAIRAKGGRDRLINVRNRLDTSRSQYVTHKGKTNSQMFSVSELK
jgi:hypothetical protein